MRDFDVQVLLYPPGETRAYEYTRNFTDLPDDPTITIRFENGPAQFDHVILFIRDNKQARNRPGSRAGDSIPMKAILFYQHGGLDVLQYADFPTPASAREVLIRPARRRASTASTCGYATAGPASAWNTRTSPAPMAPARLPRSARA